MSQPVGTLRAMKPTGTSAHRRGFCIGLLALIGVACSSGTATPAARQVGQYSATVQRVVDGDTIIVKYLDGKTDRVRILGVNTPETHKPNSPVECYGPEAERYTRSKLSGKKVRLEVDLEKRDKYNRFLAYVYLDGQRFDDELLRLGYARLMIIRPNGSHKKEMLRIELEAKSQRRGLWGAC